MIAVVDSGVANIVSVTAALHRLGAPAVVTSDVAVLATADRVILPGVGSAAAAMARLGRNELRTTLRTLTCPVLGICLGMQLMFKGSEENDGTEGLGIMDGTVRRLPATPQTIVPHMGWNTLRIEAPHQLLKGVADGSFVYFVHSYAADVDKNTLASCEHGMRFSAVVAQANYFGCQFHPERSGSIGARILQNFLSM